MKILSLVVLFVGFAATVSASRETRAESSNETAATTDHSRLMEYISADGRLLPVQTKDDWDARRRLIVAGMEEVMGPLPNRSNLPPPEVKTLKRLETDDFVRYEIEYRAEKDDLVPALLYLPKNRPAGRKAPAMLALHPTSKHGKKGIAIEDGAPPNRGYATELARRGYVVLAPDYPTFGDYHWDLSKSNYASGTMQGIFNHIRGVDLLSAKEEVDPERIGVIGHSLGGHNAMFVGVFDRRLKVIVSSCGWTPFHDYYGGKLNGWAQDRYMPRVREKFGLDPDRLPFDFYEVAAALAPRAFFSASPLRDDNFDVHGVKKAEPKIRDVYSLLEAADRLEFTYPDCPHDFPPPVRLEAYRFIDRALGHEKRENGVTQ
ncbi:MAG: alpha/beta fold hydrolase [Pirellulales bacterium]|nr:alpha/beta fold hydrolase [Pirellulales bacterium]